MSKIERVRDVLAGMPPSEYWQQRSAEGWKLQSVEWTREVTEGREAGALNTQVPYGLRVAADGRTLEEDAAEKRVLTRMMELIVEDHPLSRVAQELAREGLANRGGTPWTAQAIFDMLPRLVDAGPQIFASQEYVARKQRA